MVERPNTGPPHCAHPAAGGPPPLPDGDTVPHPPRPPDAPALTRRQWLTGWVCVGLVLLAVVIGVLR